MRVLFLQPPLGSWVCWGKHVAINVNHAQLAANLREWYPEIEIKVLDCKALDMDERKMLDVIKEIEPDLVYMGDALQTNGVAATHPRYKRTASLIKKLNKNIKICVGGFFYGANAPQILKETKEFDFIIYGETEVTMPELAKELSKKEPDIPSIKGLAYWDKDEVKVTPYRPLYENLDDLPLPAYDLFPMERYKYMETYHSRGCPNGCRFCVGWTNYDPRGNKDWMHYRIRSAKRVADELEFLEKRFGVKYIVMMDEDFNVYRSRIEGLIEEIFKRGLKVKYFFMGRAPYFLRDKDLLKDLKKSGFIQCLFGLEVTDEKTLKKIGKGITVEEVEEVVAKCRENHIGTLISWMVGFPDDDEETIKKRFERLDKIDPDISSLQMLTPLPGIPMYSEIEPYIEERDLSKWDFFHPVIRTKYLTREELGKLAAWCNYKFFSNPERRKRILFNKNLDPFCRISFRVYIKTINDYTRAAIKGEVFI
ncbi:MAG: B12-binding domain-containing radical SAM protein [Candidatus Desulfofervidus auxilii]|nr:B12-binding domain-containing radical SAM protein [Candidatus Desulfofervidus auxilii]